MEPILTTADCVAFLGVTKQTIQKAGANGILVRVPMELEAAYFTMGSVIDYAERTGRKINRKSIQAVGLARIEEAAALKVEKEAAEKVKGIRARIAAILAKLG